MRRTCCNGALSGGRKSKTDGNLKEEGRDAYQAAPNLAIALTKVIRRNEDMTGRKREKRQGVWPYALSTRTIPSLLPTLLKARYPYSAGPPLAPEPFRRLGSILCAKTPTNVLDPAAVISSVRLVRVILDSQHTKKQSENDLSRQK